MTSAYQRVDDADDMSECTDDDDEREDDHGDSEIIEETVEKNRQPCDEQEGFLSACRAGTGVRIEALLRCSTSDLLNYRDKNGQSGLSHACSVGNFGVIKTLVQSESVDVNMPDNEGNTPLMIAAEAGFDEIVRFFLFHLNGVTDANAQNVAGISALMKAALHDRTNCARILLLGGADVTKTDWSRGLRADQWADLCGAKTTAIAIRKVSKCVLTKEEVEEFHWIKKKSAIRELYEWLESKLRRSFKLKSVDWERNAGATYHLVANAYKLHAGFTAAPHVRSPGSRFLDDDSIVISSVTDDVTKDERLVATMTCGEGRERRNFPPGIKSSRSSHSLASSQGKVPKEIPTVRYTVASPVSKNKQCRAPRDYHRLQVPKRSSKKKKTAAPSADTDLLAPTAGGGSGQSI